MTKKKNKSMIQRRLIPTYIFLAIVSLVSVFPFYWMIMAATNDYVDISRGKLTFGTAALENFRNLIDQQPLALAMKNSFVYAISVTVICLLICSLAGYGYEIYHDKWKDKLFSVILLGMMIPQVATIVPYVYKGTPDQYSCWFLPSDDLHAVYDHDVPTEFPCIPGRYRRSCTN